MTSFFFNLPTLHQLNTKNLKKKFWIQLNLRNLIFNLNQKGKTIHAYGASTKGNVLMQFCGLTSEHT